MRTARPQGVLLSTAHLSVPRSRPRLSRSKNDSSSPGTSDQRPVVAKLAFPGASGRTPTVRVADLVHSSAADSNCSRNLCVAKEVLAQFLRSYGEGNDATGGNQTQGARGRGRARRQSASPSAARNRRSGSDRRLDGNLVPMPAEGYASAPILWRESLHRRLLGVADVALRRAGLGAGAQCFRSAPGGAGSRSAASR